MQARLANIRAKEKAQREKYLKSDQSFKKRKIDVKKSDGDDEEEYVLDDYESDQENGGVAGGSSGLSAATLELMRKIGMGPVASEDEDEEVEDEIKVSLSISNADLHLTTFSDLLLLPNTLPAHSIYQ